MRIHLAFDPQPNQIRECGPCRDRASQVSPPPTCAADWPMTSRQGRIRSICLRVQHLPARGIEIEEEFTGDRLAQDFKQLEKGAAAGSVDVQLLALKQKMGMLPASSNEKRAIGSGRQDEETVHAEIEETSEKKSH